MTNPQPKIILSLALHNHQPVGNFGWVFQQAYDRAYLPAVELLERYPGIRLALHYTGPLRDWLVQNQPSFLPRVRALVQRGQVEMMGGAYYEPILAALPDADKAGQLVKLSDAVEADFSARPKGMWLAERVWEPHLVRHIAQAGLEYTIVDDTHFKANGYGDEQLLGYYVSEEQGQTLKILPISKDLRYLIPFRPVEEIIDWLRAEAHAGDHDGLYTGRVKAAVFGDDGEKFGEWPGTYNYIWAEGWMERFFRALEDNRDWLQLLPPGELAQQHPALGRIYLPTASYQEMGDWVMPAQVGHELHQLRKELEHTGRDDVAKYLRGGYWRQFMVKYPEINHLHKKMQQVSAKVHNMPGGERKNKALEALWASQCNCGYWHGVFGGVYLFHIREADYRLLIEAENLAEGIDRDEAFTQKDVLDFDADGLPEIVLANAHQHLVIDLDQGGSVVEWDHRRAAYNLLNVMTRRQEAYHTQILAAVQKQAAAQAQPAGASDAPPSIHDEEVRMREPDLADHLIYDWHRRASLLDHFFPADTSLEAFARGQYRELGDFVNQPYTFDAAEEGAALRLSRQGGIWQGEDRLSLSLVKAVQLEGSRLVASYRLENTSQGVIDTRFGVECAWGLAAGNDTAHNILELDEAGLMNFGALSDHEPISTFGIVSTLWRLSIQAASSQPAHLWVFPLETVSASEAGYERNYQGSVTLLHWPLRLAPGEQWQVQLEFVLA